MATSDKAMEDGGGKMAVDFCGLSKIVGGDDMGLVILADKEKERQIVIPCDKHMVYQLQLRYLNMPHCRLLSLEALWDMMGEMADAERYYVFVNGITDGHYTALLVDRLINKVHQLRPSDGVLLHLVTGIPLYVDRALFMKQCSKYEHEEGRVSMPINVISNKMLQRALERAIEEEDYEMASQVRDEIRSRQQHKQQKEE